MSLSDLASLGSLISGFAVLVSLIFLYFQLRQLNLQVKQTEKNQQAVIAQGRKNRMVDSSMRLAEPTLAEAMWKANTGADDLSQTQMWQHVYHAAAVFWNFEDSFYQFKKGLMNAEDFATDVNAMKFIVASAAIRASWKQNHAVYAKEFVEFVNALIAEVPVRTYPPDQLVRWKSTFLNESKKAIG